MPAPAVIPAPRVYFKVVAVKTLVVYLRNILNIRSVRSLFDSYHLVLFASTPSVFLSGPRSSVNNVDTMMGVWGVRKLQL